MNKNNNIEEKYVVQVNPSNGQAFINLSKKSGYKKGDTIGVIKKTDCIYREDFFVKYINDEKERLFEMFNRIKKLRKESFSGEYINFILNKIPELIGLGKQEGSHDEPVYYTNSNFSFDYKEIDGGTYGDVIFFIDKIFNDYKNKDSFKNDKDLKDELEDYMRNLLISKLFDQNIDGYNNQRDIILKEYGFELEMNSGLWYFTNGKIKVIIDEGGSTSISLEYYQDYNRTENVYNVDFEKQDYDIHQRR